MVAARRTINQAKKATTSAITRVTSRLALKTLASSQPAPKPSRVSTVRIDHPPDSPSTRPMSTIDRPLTVHSLVTAGADRHLAAASVAAHCALPPHPEGVTGECITERDAAARYTC